MHKTPLCSGVCLSLLKLLLRVPSDKGYSGLFFSLVRFFSNIPMNFREAVRFPAICRLADHRPDVDS